MTMIRQLFVLGSRDRLIYASVYILEKKAKEKRRSKEVLVTIRKNVQMLLKLLYDKKKEKFK